MFLKPSQHKELGPRWFPGGRRLSLPCPLGPEALPAAGCRRRVPGRAFPAEAAGVARGAPAPWLAPSLAWGQADSLWLLCWTPLCFDLLSVAQTSLALGVRFPCRPLTGMPTQSASPQGGLAGSGPPGPPAGGGATGTPSKAGRAKCPPRSGEGWGKLGGRGESWVCLWEAPAGWLWGGDSLFQGPGNGHMGAGNPSRSLQGQ